MLLNIKPAIGLKNCWRLLKFVQMTREWTSSRKNLVCILAILSYYLHHSFQLSAAAQKTWRSPIYSFFKSDMTIQEHNGHVAHFFTCSALKCRSEAGGVRCFQDKGNKSSAANLQHHAVRCFGEDTVNMAVKGEPGVSRSGNIFSRFACQGQQPVMYSHCVHSTPEFW
jgi:hypothetical protein